MAAAAAPEDRCACLPPDSGGRRCRARGRRRHRHRGRRRGHEPAERPVHRHRRPAPRRHDGDDAQDQAVVRAGRHASRRCRGDHAAVLPVAVVDIHGPLLAQHGVRTNRSATFLDPRNTLQHSLHDAGYFTGMFGKYLNEWSDLRGPPYFDRFSVFDSGYNSFRANEQGTLKQINQYSTNYIRDQALSLPSAVGDERQPAVVPLPGAVCAAPAGGSRRRSMRTRRSTRLRAEPGDMGAGPQRQAAVGRVLPAGSERDSQHRALMLRTLPSVDNMVDAVMQWIQDQRRAEHDRRVHVRQRVHERRAQPGGARTGPTSIRCDVPMYWRWPGHIGDRRRRQPPGREHRHGADGAGATGVTPSRVDGRAQHPRQHVVAEPDADRVPLPGRRPDLGVAHDGDLASTSRPSAATTRSASPSGSTTTSRTIPTSSTTCSPTATPPTTRRVAALSAQVAEDRVCAGLNCP